MRARVKILKKKDYQIAGVILVKTKQERRLCCIYGSLFTRTSGSSEDLLYITYNCSFIEK